MKYLVIDYVLNFSFIVNSKAEFIEGMGYDIDEITFEELVDRLDGEYEVIEFKNKSEIKHLMD
jgi:hypothetical protein